MALTIAPTTAVLLDKAAGYAVRLESHLVHTPTGRRVGLHAPSRSRRAFRGKTMSRSPLLARLKIGWWWLTDAEWRRRYSADHRRVQRFRRAQQVAIRHLLPASGDRILAGPFAGMRFPQANQPNACCAQILLGTYELEVHETIERICQTSYSVAVDIGAADGFYVCGLKRRMPGLRVIAFESVPEKHAGIRDLCRENGVGQDIVVLGHCDAAALQAQLAHERRPLVFCDIDGGEVEVLDPLAIPGLSSADILVETHDGLREGITDLLIDRFSASHDVQLIRERPRSAADGPRNTGLSDNDLVGAMDEFRGFPQAWLWMTARQHEADPSVSLRN